MSEGQRGLALITALLVLSFLTIVGGALLTTTTIDVKISDNYITNIQLQFLAEAGTEAARETLRVSVNSISTALGTAAGHDGTLSTARDLTALLATDDQPLLPANNALRATGQALVDQSGQTMGTYHVFVRNDSADGAVATADTNDVVELVSIARIGNATKTIVTVVKRGSFPPIPAALTLNGGVCAGNSPKCFEAANSNLFHIDGDDQAGSGNSENAIGVISHQDDDGVTNAIPSNRQANYTGFDGGIPNVGDVSGELAGTLTTTSGLETLVSSIASSSTDSHTPGLGRETVIGSIGGADDYRVVTVHGDCDFGPGTGYGILLVRGVLRVRGNFTWNGLILVIGQGELHWNDGGNGEVQGGIFIAKTRGTRTANDPLGPMLPTRGDVVADVNGGGGNGVRYDTTMINNANSTFPYSPISIREY